MITTKRPRANHATARRLARARRACGALAAVVLLASSAGSAAAAAVPSGRVLAEHASSPARTDGADTIGFASQPGMVQVTDGGGAPSFAADVSGGCLEPPTRIRAVGGGQVLFDCSLPLAGPYGSYPHGIPQLLDLAQRTVREPAGVRGVISWYQRVLTGDGWFDDVGAHGLLAHGGGYKSGPQPIGLTFAAGAWVMGEGSPGEVFDLDSPSLRTTLCEPLRRSRNDEIDDPDFWFGSRYDAFAYEPPYALTNGARTGLALLRCGSRERILLRPGALEGPRVEDAALAAGFASWRVDDGEGEHVALHAFLPSCRAQLAWQVDRATEVAHVDGALVVSQPAAEAERWRIVRVPLDASCARVADATDTVLAAAGRIRAPRLRSASTTDAATGAVVSAVPRAGARDPRLAVAAGERIGLRLREPATSVRWRVGAGPWRAVGGEGRRWSLAAPALRRERVVRLLVRRATGAAELSVRLRPQPGPPPRGGRR